MRSIAATLFFGTFLLAGTGGAAAASAERGDYLVNTIMACGSCHTPFGPAGSDPTKALSGRLVEESPAFTAIAPNLTPAGHLADWSDAELGKAIREGIRPDGSLIGPPMPFEVYKGISDDDLASIIAYLRTIPAIENDPGQSAYNIPLPPAYGPPIDSVASVPEGVRASVHALAGDDPLEQRRVLATLRANGVTGPVTLPPGASTAVPSGQPAPAPVASPDVDALSRWESLREKGAHITAAAFRATHGAAIDRALAARGARN